MSFSESLKDFDHFFGGNPAGHFFLQAMLEGTAYTKPGKQSSRMTQVLRAANYSDCSKVTAGGAVMGPDDVHYFVADLIISTALYHCKLDKSAKVGTNLSDACDRIVKSLKEYFGDTGNDIYLPGESAPKYNPFNPLKSAQALENAVAALGDKIGTLGGVVDANRADMKAQMLALYSAIQVAQQTLKHDIAMAQNEARNDAGTNNGVVNTRLTELLSAQQIINRSLTDAHTNLGILRNNGTLIMDRLGDVGDNVRELQERAPQRGPRGPRGPRGRGQGQRGRGQGQRGGAFKDEYGININTPIIKSYLLRAADLAASSLTEARSNGLSPVLSINTVEEINKLFVESDSNENSLSEVSLYRYVSNNGNHDGGAYDAIERLQKDSGLVDDGEFLNNMVEAIIDCVQRQFEQLVVSMMDKMAEEPRSTRGTASLYDVAYVKKFVTKNEKTYKNLLIKLIEDNVCNCIAEAIAHEGVLIPHTSLGSSNVAKEFFLNIYNKWGSMDDDVRKFYVDNISVFVKQGSALIGDYEAASGFQKRASSWVRLSDEAVLNLLKNPQLSTNLNDVRVNLLKGENNRDILFAAHLPLVSPSVKVWYTKKDGSFGYVQNPAPEFLRNLYMKVYSSCNTNGIKDVTGVEPNFEARMRKFTYPPAVHARLSESMLRLDDETMESAMSDPTSEIDYAFLSSIDMVYGKSWYYDSNKGQYYRADENGGKIYYDVDEDLKNPRACYGTYLAKGNPDKCRRIIECIGSFDSKNLNMCLDVLGDVDLWDIAEEDAKKVGPPMIRGVLAKFGVKAYKDTNQNGESIIVPMTFGEWKQSLLSSTLDVPDNAKKVILGNKKLLRYLEGLIGICRANPSILNKSVTSVVVRDNLPEYARALGLKYFRLPGVNNLSSQYDYFSQSLKSMTQPHNVTQNMFNPLTSGSFSNTMLISPLAQSQMVPFMMGGGYTRVPQTGGVEPIFMPTFAAASNPSLITAGTGYSMENSVSALANKGSASTFVNIVKNIQLALKDVGLQLHKTDQDKLSGTIRKIEQYELKLAKLCSVLISIVKLARFWGIGLDNIDRDHPRVLKLSDVTSIDQLKDVIRGYAREVQRSLVTQLNLEQGIAHELMHVALPKIIDQNLGKSEDSGIISKAITSNGDRTYIDLL